jgi:hypothetical protein
MIWFSVRQEAADVFGPRQVSRDPGLPGEYLKCIILYDVFACLVFDNNK